MKKLVISLAIASSLGLSGCGGNETIKDVVKAPVSVVTPLARVIFDPSNGVLSVPNDLLFSGTKDGTLNLPLDPGADGSDPFFALSALDGWSTVNPFVLGIDFPAQTSLDANSVFNSASVRIFEAIMGGDLNDAECNALERGLACKIIGELTFGVDFVPKAVGNSIAIIPLKPLKAKTTYILALTNNIQDDQGTAVAGSPTYESVKQDIATKPLGSAAQLGLQAVINSYENATATMGLDKNSIIYTMAMTTQSTGDVFNTIKSLMVGNLQQGKFPTIGVQDTGLSVANVLVGAGVLAPDSPSLPLFSTANYMQGSITLPYYLGIPTAANPKAPVNEWWTSLCDSAAMLAGLAAANPDAIPANPVSVSDGTCMAISQAAGLPAPGLRDLSSVFPLDTERNLTKFSPVPKPSAPSDLPWIKDPGKITVQMTTPDINVANAVRANLGLPAMTEPDAGWPVVILQHGITSKKEDMLSLTGILSLYGMATVAIDHPLHGSRGFDLNNDGIDDINASTVSATHYMNLASLLTTRDNLRQSTADILGLRFGLNFLGGVDAAGDPIKVDTSKVTFVGHSLGAITGINFIALTNSPLNPAVDGLFHVTANTQANPGVMVATLLLESGAFGDVIKSNLVYAQSAAFKALVDANFPDGASEAQLVATYRAFYDALDATQQAGLQSLFSQFSFAAQTVTDSGDPVNYMGAMAATQTPTHLIEVVGNGSDNLGDQVIPNTVSTSPLSGTEAAIALLGLPGVSETTQDSEATISGAVRYLFGHHASILSPVPRAEAPDPVMTGRATQEMQSQVANFLSSEGHLITVTDSEVVK
ncbi:MAG: lipase [Gammaproteobacteria bacterium]|nr:MAG: lipase [Gammaproteobacteria bacterium]